MGIFDWLRPKPPRPQPVPQNEIQDLLQQHNYERPANAQLALDDRLMRSAQKYAEWMAANDRLTHGDFSGRIKAEGYENWNIGENIAEGSNTVEDVMDEWMHSLGHREQIENRSFKNVGFGIATSAGGTRYWCTDFGG